MGTRRQTLRVVVSSLLAPVLDGPLFAEAAGLKSRLRATDPACSSCAVNQDIQTAFANVLDSAHLLKHVSLPRSLSPVLRSARAGMPVQYVESATGHLTFAVEDLSLKGFPALDFTRIYNSGISTDSGLGKGWALSVDDRIVINGAGATMITAFGDSVQFHSGTNPDSFATSKPGLTTHKAFLRVDQNTLRERVSVNIARVYSRIGNTYYLTAFDYGEAGSVHITRDATGRVTAMKSSVSGHRMDLIWSPQGQLAGVKDSAGRSIQFSYAGNLLLGHKDATGAQWQLTYAEQLLSRVVDPAGTAILDVNYSGGRAAQTKTIAGLFQYIYHLNAAGGVASLSVSNANGTGWEYSHNDDGRITAVKSLDGSTGRNATLTYDNAGYLVNTNSASGISDFAYDRAGRLISRKTGKIGRQWQYHEDGRLLSTTDGAGTTAYSYDLKNNTKRATSSRKIRNYSATYAGGRLATLAHGKRNQSFSYNAMGLLNSVSSKKNNTLQFGYDASGHLISERIANNYSSFARRNARGQLTDWSDSRGSQFSFLRDSRGAVVQITNTRGDWAKATRDAAGRIVRIANSRSQARVFAYDDEGALTSWTDAKSRTFAVAYDPTTRRASHMVQTNGSLNIVRDSKGAAIVQAGRTAAVVAPGAITNQAFDDGWQDPLFGTGLLGSFSGVSRYAALESTRKPGGSVPAGLASMLVAGSMETGDDGDDYGDDDGADDGDDEDDDGDDDGDCPESSAPAKAQSGMASATAAACVPPKPDCQPCMAAFQSTCTRSRDDAYAGAQKIELAALAGCALVVETGPGAVLCVAAALYVYSGALDTANTNYENCASLVPQNCYSQCH